MPIKKTASKVKKTTRRTSSKAPQGNSIFYRRIIIVTACLLMVVGIFAVTNRQVIDRSVAGTSIARGLYLQATIEIPQVQNAVSYNIYYKQANEKNFTNTARDISASVDHYTISHLHKNADYQYRLAAVDSQGREFLWSEITSLTDLQPME